MGRTYLSLALLWTLSCQGADNPLSFPAVPANPDYEAVVALPTRPADQRLQYGAESLQFGRLWLPAASDRPAPLAVFIHGGCWRNSFDMSHAYALASALSQSGLAVWSLEYRRTGDPGGGWPGTYEDVSAGIAHARELATYGVAIDDFVILGHSAGGHLALLAGRDHPQANAVIGLAAISDLTRYAQGSNSCQLAAPAFLGASVEDDPQRYRQADPARQDLHAHTYLLQGGADDIVPVAQGTLDGATTVLEEDAGHFDWIHPGTPAFARLMDLLDTLIDR